MVQNGPKPDLKWIAKGSEMDLKWTWYLNCHWPKMDLNWNEHEMDKNQTCDGPFVALELLSTIDLKSSKWDLKLTWNGPNRHRIMTFKMFNGYHARGNKFSCIFTSPFENYSQLKYSWENWSMWICKNNWNVSFKSGHFLDLNPQLQRRCARVSCHRSERTPAYRYLQWD